MSGSKATCCIKKCGKTREDNVRLHSFTHPEIDRDRFQSWINNVGLSDSSLSEWYIYQNRRVCHLHFEEKYLTWSSRLSNGAIPTMNIPGFQENVTMEIDATATAIPSRSLGSEQTPEKLVLMDISNINTSYMQPTHAASTSSHPLQPGFEETPKNPVLMDISNINTSCLQPTHAASTSSHALQPGSEETPEKPVLMDISNINTSCLQPTHAASTSSHALQPGSEETPEKPVLMDKPVRKRKGTYKDDNKVLSEMLRKMTKKKENYAARLKKARKLSENTTFLNIMKKFTTFAAIFMAMQFREIKHKKMGRRFTDDEKVMALSIYKNGPKCYRLLSKFFILPSYMTLSRLIARANLRAGINEKLFKIMKKKVTNMRADDKLCVLLFDEVAITPHFDYNRRKDEIEGFVTNGSNKERKIADHALVFMIRGVLRNYKQPIAYTFCSGSTKKEELADLITVVIKKIESIGLRVVATVCDQGASNVSAINHLIFKTKQKYLRRGEELSRNIFEIEDSTVVPLYDAPHLIKGIRNNMLTKNLVCKINGKLKTAKWDHIQKLYNEDPSYAGVRLLKNLTADHINPEKCKMRVKFATQIFSQKVGSTMGYLAEKKILPEECKETADVILFFDELFDSVNGSFDNSKKRRGKPLLGPLTPGSCHSDVWAKAKPVLRSMKFIVNGREKSIPSVNNWLQTIENIEYLRDILFNTYKITSIWMRHFNQDPLENFFGAVRNHGCRNINPSPDGFAIAFASLLISNLTGTHSPGSNCEQDSCSRMFNSMKLLFKKTKNVDNMSQNVDISYMFDESVFVDFNLKKNDPRVLAQLEYVTGYLLQQAKKRVFGNCSVCKQNLFNERRDNEYLRAREFNKKYLCLQYPKDIVLQMYSRIQDLLNWVLKYHSDLPNIRNYAKTLLYVEINANFIQCEKHKKDLIEFMYDFVCRFYINNYCKNLNNILNGRDKDRDTVAEDTIKKQAYEYFEKRKRNKK